MATTTPSQHAKSSKRKASGRRPVPWAPFEGSNSMTAHTRIAANGRIVIPAVIREKMGLRPDESVVMELQDGVLRIESYFSRIRRIQAEFAHLSPTSGKLASDEFILERRQEALLENESFERARQLRRIRDGFEDPDSPPVSDDLSSPEDPRKESELA